MSPRAIGQATRGQCPDKPYQHHINASDAVLNVLNYQDFPTLCHVREKLVIKAKDSILDVTFWSQIVSMVGTLNLYLDPELSYMWQDASLIVTKSQGLGIQNGSKCARNIYMYMDLSRTGLPI